jgi:choline dehydrogenase-like flavoprotein
LAVLSGAQVEKVHCAGGIVSAVDIRRNTRAETVQCRQEVILSAGAIGTPEILLASGIGDGAALQAQGIAPVLDLPGVGKNLQDHVDGMITVRSKSTQTLGLSFANLPRMLAAPFQYWRARKGMLSTNYVEAGGFAKTKYASALPDIQFHFVPGYRSHRGKLVEYGHGYAVHTCVLRPKSRGEVRLARTDQGHRLEIDHKFFSDSYDEDVLVEGIKVARSILACAVFDDVRGVEMLPGDTVQSDDALRAYLRQEALTVYHPVGTAKMGTDAMAVVSPTDLKVKGMANLRVADGAIMPTLIGGNTNAPCMMIGQKAADMVLQDAG